jgi:hypothetical protein
MANYNGSATLEQYIPLPQAARRLGISVIALRHLAESGQVKAVSLPGGKIGVSENGVHAVQLDRFIPLSKAAHQFGIGQNILRQLIESGKIRAATLQDGEIAVSETSAQVAIINEQLKAVKREDFKRLHNRSISTAEAMRRYNVLDRTLRYWAKRGIVTVLESGYGMLLDEADVAYCAKIYHIRKISGSLSGAPLLDENGKPNLLKHPELSEYRRKKKTSPR